MFEKLKGKKFYRSPRNGLLFGVASGLARYFEVDAVFVRLIIIVLAFFTDIWLTILVYAIAVFLMPIDPAQATVATHQEPKDVTRENDEGQMTNDEKKFEEPSEAPEMDRDQNI